MISLLVAAATSAAWVCDVTYVVDGRTADAERRTMTIHISEILKSKKSGPYSINGVPGRSFAASWIQGNSLVQLVQTGRAMPAKLTIDEPLTDGHAAHADGKCHFKRAAQ